MSRHFLIVCLLVCGCNRQPDPPAQTKAAQPAPIRLDDQQKPIPPFETAVPPEPDKMQGKLDLTKEPPGRLRSMASQASRSSKNADAMQLQYWGYKQDGKGLYNLACYTALNSQNDAAFHWLHKYGREEGADVSMTLNDDDFRGLRPDPRWNDTIRFLRACQEYWTKHGKHEDTLVLPSDYNGKDPIPLVIGLHGMGSSANAFVEEDDYGDWSDDLKVAFVGVAGTRIRGKNSYVWTENADLDHERIVNCLKGLEGKVKEAPGKTILFGFSQGGMMAAEIAARHPDRYAGAIILSPGGLGNGNLAGVERQPAHAKQWYYSFVGAGEHPGNVALAKYYWTNLQKLGSTAHYKGYPGVTAHAFPPDYGMKLPEWLGKIWKHREK